VIRYALVCERGHAFESWFKSSAAFDTQVASELLACPSCGSPKVDKAVMAPAITKHGPPPKETPAAARPAPATPTEGRSPVAILSQRERELRAKLKELRDDLIRNADYVGTQFPEEARKMHYGEIDHRSIYGEASADDAASLAEEGIEFHPLPHLPDERN
jgi:hypothetical protein